MTTNRTLTAVAAIAFVAASGIGVEAQSFGEPRLDRAGQVRMGGFFPDGDDLLFEDNETRFTFDTSDLDDFTIGFTYLASISNSFEVGFNLDFYDATTTSAERDYVDEDGFLILHDTTLSQILLAVDVRVLPFGRYRERPGGRRVLQPVVYLGAGAGLTFWEYEEVGDFVDSSNPLDPVVFFGRFKDSDTAFRAHAVAGVELPVNPRMQWLVETRYAWADDDLTGDLASFESIELGGWSAYAGLSFRF